jgi:hypothetical protein
MFGFTKQDITINSMSFLYSSIGGGVMILTGFSYILGSILIGSALLNLDAHYDYIYLKWIMTRLWDKLHPDRLKKFVHWRYWEEFKEHDLIRKPDFTKPKIPKFVEKQVELSLFETFRDMKERLENGQEIKTPLFEVEKDNASTG